MATANHSIGDGAPRPSKLWPDTPESVISDQYGNYHGTPYDVVLCALLRAHAVTLLLNSEFSDPDRDRLGDALIVTALWDIQGNLEIAQHLLSSVEVRRPPLG